MGRTVHFEILVDRPGEIAHFYETVFNWKVNRWPDPEPGVEQGYFLLETGERHLAGIDGAIMHPHFDQKVINTIEVDDLKNTIEAVRNAGGKLIHGPNVVSGVGTHAYCQDPAGVIFGVMQPRVE